MKVLVEFKNSHHYFKEYKKSQLYCPNCGKKEVWIEQGMEDYLEGPDYCCSDCGYIFVRPFGCRRDNSYVKILKQLKALKTNTPTTPKG